MNTQTLSKWNWLFAAIVVLGLAMRMTALGARPMHHDESIHATFSYQWDENPDHSYYKYDPTYHGPFLYTVTRFLFPIFGVGVAQARLFPLIFGILVMFSPFFFRIWLGEFAVKLAVSILALSPLCTYYSRFLAHDMPSLFFAVGALACGLHLLKSREGDDEWAALKWLCLGAASLGLLYSVKAVSFLYTFIYLTFMLMVWAQRGFPRIKPDTSKLKFWFLALAVFLVSYGIFQTSLFNHPDGFADGLFFRVLTYWWGQHTIERVVGPVTFHLRSMLLHELPVVLALLVGMIAITRRVTKGNAWLAALGVVLLVTVPMPWVLKDKFPGLEGLFAMTKLKASPDIFLYEMAFVFGILGSWRLLREGKRMTALLVYWSFSSLAIYSFVGEKAPWLTVHVMYPAALLTASLIAAALPGFLESVQGAPWKRRLAVGLVLFAALYQARLAYFVTFMTAGEPSDLLSQVHNTKDVQFVVEWMKRTAMETGERTEGLPIAILGTPTWAFYFYLIEGGFKRFILDAGGLNGSQRFVITDEPNEKTVGPKLAGMGYRVAKMNHSGWWVPEHNNVGWLDWVHYALTRKPTGNVGLTPMFVFYKPLETPAAVAPLPERPNLANKKPEP